MTANTESTNGVHVAQLLAIVLAASPTSVGQWRAAAVPDHAPAARRWLRRRESSGCTPSRAGLLES